jgi:hypothetical protein
MSHVSPPTALALQQAGFPQPRPAFGQLWYNLDGPMLILSEKDGFIVYTNGRLEGYNKTLVIRSLSAVYFDTPGKLHKPFYAATEIDILSHLRAQHREATLEAFDYCFRVQVRMWTVVEVPGGVQYDPSLERIIHYEHSNAAEAAAKLYLTIF